MDKLDHVFDRIDKDIGTHIDRLQEFIRQPTISNTGEGMDDGAKLLQGFFKKLGCQRADIVPTPGWPVVYGKYDVGAKKTLIIYMMYDCMPADEPGWIVPPFEAKIVDNFKIGDFPPFRKALVARGAINSKGPLVAFINSMSSYRAAVGELPVNLIFVAEGEEEQASRHLPLFIAEHKDELQKADAMFFPMGGQSVDGAVTMMPGTKGIAYFELECSGATWGRGPTSFDIHGSNKVIVDSPVWRMIHALKSMTSEDGNHCTINGWYDNVEPPNEEENEIIDDLVKEHSWSPMKQALRVNQLLMAEEKRREILVKYFCEPSGLNIDGIWGGYIGEGSKTVLPHKVSVKMDVRFVPNQRGMDFLPKLRAHLDSYGYQDIGIKQLTVGEWARTSVRSPLWRSLKETYKSFGLKPRVHIRNIGYAPFSLFSGEPLHLRGGFAWGMLGHGTRAHSPNEYFVIDGNDRVKGLAECEKSFASVIHKFAKK